MDTTGNTRNSSAHAARIDDLEKLRDTLRAGRRQATSLGLDVLANQLSREAKAVGELADTEWERLD